MEIVIRAFIPRERCAPPAPADRHGGPSEKDRREEGKTAQRLAGEERAERRPEEERGAGEEEDVPVRPVRPGDVRCTERLVDGTGLHADPPEGREEGSVSPRCRANT